jgi:hypothetical protein
MFTVKLELCADNKASLRVNSESIAGELNAVSGTKSCLICIYYPELRLNIPVKMKI